MKLKLPVRLCAAVFALLLAFHTAWAEGIVATRFDGRISDNGKLIISSRFQTELPEQLSDALKRGVPLDFVLDYQLERPRSIAYRLRLNQLFGSGQSVGYRLSYHPLTNRYRVAVGTFSTEYNSLKAALRAVGAIVNWQVLDEGTLSDTPPHQVRAQVRLSLTASRLPKPFQINALTSKGWQLDSGWKTLEMGR